MILITLSSINLDNLGIVEMLSFITYMATLSDGSIGIFQISMIHTFELHKKKNIKYFDEKYVVITY